MRWNFLLLPVLLISCSSSGPEVAGKEEAHEHSVDRIHLGKEMEEILGMGVYVAGKGVLVERKKYPAEVIRSYKGVATVRARFPGMVLEIGVNPGDRVRRGQVLARIESDESFTVYALRSPISGVVSRIMVSEGVVVDRGVPLMEITAPSKVWVRAMVWPSEVDFVYEGKGVVFHRHYGDRYVEIPGRIFFVAPYLDSTTRMIPVLVSLRRSDILRPGMYGDLLVADTHRVNIAIPVSAVHVLEGDTLVFVKEGDGARPRRISTGRSDGEMVEVVSGLEEGDTVFSEHSFLLRAEMEKGIWMGAHEHAH